MTRKWRGAIGAVLLLGGICASYLSFSLEGGWDGAATIAAIFLTAFGVVALWEARR